VSYQRSGNRGNSTLLDQEGRMHNTLISGFGPYGSVQNNPTMRLAAHFAVNPVPGHRLTTFVFPVTYGGVAASMRTILNAGRPFDTVLMLGANPGAPDWRIERYGVNQNDLDAPDAEGVVVTSHKIVDGAPDTLSATIDCDAAVSSILAAGLPASISEDAGRYLCNHLMFVTLSMLYNHAGVRAGFLHVPPDELTYDVVPDGVTTYSFADQVCAVEAVLGSLV